MCIVTGPNQVISTKLIEVKGLFEPKLGVTIYRKGTVLELNGCSFQSLDSYNVLIDKFDHVQELLVKGFSEYNIATELKVSQSTVSKDISYVQQQARENIQKHIQERLPQE
jgi:hypothetical protein